eukprot:gnl/TRDRNA2_/TRDRNA2_132153_c0_seq1.p1 gnl/TRDRNA2_/TRDRNA2_132153_c0~~gnl/TRDRNA2_/TRDRNA2_132153_c0_seq1.p1  ORF type:complete len:160 (-),score=12.86 gnl/TRDRNA2_/TRDRNA2_132153_c0_seq1:65-544(-)
MCRCGSIVCYMFAYVSTVVHHYKAQITPAPALSCRAYGAAYDTASQLAEPAQPPDHSLQVDKNLMGDAMVLACRELLVLTGAVALAVGAKIDAGHAVVVLLEPCVAVDQADRLDVVDRVLNLSAFLVRMRRNVLREVLEEGWAVREAHDLPPLMSTLER